MSKGGKKEKHDKKPEKGGKKIISFNLDEQEIK
jgi:hypothetical protein